MMKDCPQAKDNIREGVKVSFSDVEDGIQMKNRFYVLQSKVDQE